jgi:hypothetical protein
MNNSATAQKSQISEASNAKSAVPSHLSRMSESRRNKLEEI